MAPTLAAIAMLAMVGGSREVELGKSSRVSFLGERDYQSKANYSTGPVKITNGLGLKPPIGYYADCNRWKKPISLIT
jgi:hypothetical protein